MKIIDGKQIAEEIRTELKKEVENLKITPGLAIILVGDNPASEVYIKNKLKACEEIGIKGELYRFDENNSENEIKDCIISLNDNKHIDGIIVQSPIPNKFNEDYLTSLINSSKDVDGFGITNMGYLATNKKDGMLSATPYGIIKILEHENISVAGKNVVIVGRSNIVGRPLALALLNRDATVTITHSYTKDLKNITNKADILIVAIGKAKFITDEYVKEDAVVIDVGINRIDGKLYGDVDFEAVKNKAFLITPVPGGVGPMTITMLLSNTIESAKKRNKNDMEERKNG